MSKTNDAVRDFLAQHFAEKGLDMATISREIGKNHSYIQQFIRYKKPGHLPDVTRRKLASVLGISERKLQNPLIDSFDPEAPEPIQTNDADSENAARNLRSLRPGEIVEREVVAGLGSGGYAKEIIVDGKAVDNISAVWTFPVPYIRTELRANETDIDIIPVDGDSMKPTLATGDRVLVHRGARSPSPDGIFAIDDGIGMAIKRLSIVHGSDPLQVRIVSDGVKDHVDIVNVDSLKVIGRVICKISRL